VVGNLDDFGFRVVPDQGLHHPRRHGEVWANVEKHKS